MVEWPTAPIFGFDYEAYVYSFFFHLLSIISVLTS